MPHYKRYDACHLRCAAQKRLGRVYVSDVARAFLAHLVDGQGQTQLRECLREHSSGNHGLVPDDDEQRANGWYDEDVSVSVYEVRDLLEVVTDRPRGRTFVTLGSELRQRSRSRTEAEQALKELPKKPDAE